MESNDISKRTVLVLLVLTLVISVVGTWTILSQPTTIYKTINQGRPQVGEVRLNIIGNEPAQVYEPQVDSSNGKVGVKIIK